MGERTGAVSARSADDYPRYLAAVALFHQSAAEASGLSGSDYRASLLLELDGPMTSGELARRLGLSAPATTRLVDRLVALGVAVRHTDPDDRRRTVVAHTGVLPAGLEAVLDTVRGPIGQALADLTDEQRSGLAAYVVAASAAYAEAARAI